VIAAHYGNKITTNQSTILIITSNIVLILIIKRGIASNYELYHYFLYQEQKVENMFGWWTHEKECDN